MSLSYPDAFAFHSEENLDVYPVFQTDLRVWYYRVMGMSFSDWFLFCLFGNSGSLRSQEFPLLVQYFKDLRTSYEEGDIDLDTFDVLMQWIDGESDELKKEFYTHVSAMERTLSPTYGERRRVISSFNGYDFLEYFRWISATRTHLPVSELLCEVKPHKEDFSKSFDQEMSDSIKKIAKRVNTILWYTAILEHGEIVDEDITVFSALESIFSWKVFLTKNGKIVPWFEEYDGA